MTCERARPLLGPLHDGELDEADRADLLAHVEACDGCQEELLALDALADALQDAIPQPPAEAWRAFDRELRAKLVEPAPSELERARLLRPWLKAAPGLAVAAAALLGAGVPLAIRYQEPTVALGKPRLPMPSLPYADPPWPARGPSLDPAQVRGLEAAVAALPDEAARALVEEGLVQQRLGADAPEEALLPHVAPLWTADASLLVVGGAASRAALALERDLVVPALVELLAATSTELARFERTATDDGVRLAAAAARERLAVAAALLGREPALGPGERDRVRAEVAAVRLGRGRRRSPVLGREVDDRAFRPRGAWAEDPTRADVARAAAWLGASGFRLDDEAEARAGALVALAVAQARTAGGRPALATLERVEGALELLHGEPDGLQPTDLLEGARQALGVEALRPSQLADPRAVAAIRDRAAVEARARGRARLAGHVAPVLRLAGGARGLEAAALSALVAPALPWRSSQAGSLDLLALLGSRRARTAVSAAQADGPGYDEALEALRAASAAWREPGGRVPVRGCLEQGRLWAAAALVDGAGERSGLAAAARYRDRLLLAALAGLDAPAASSRRPAPGATLPLLVEPLPRLHARLAFTARRLALACESLGEPAPAVAAAAAQLRRAADLEEALRDASLDLLAGRPVRPTAAAALAGWADLLATLAPARVQAAEDLLEVEGAAPSGGASTRVLHRVVWGVDRLLLVVPDPVTGAPRVGCGPALAAGEVWTEGARLRPDDVAALPREDPAWATHLR